jgi:hypothetical protein
LKYGVRKSWRANICRVASAKRGSSGSHNVAWPRPLPMLSADTSTTNAKALNERCPVGADTESAKLSVRNRLVVATRMLWAARYEAAEIAIRRQRDFLGWDIAHVAAGDVIKRRWWRRDRRLFLLLAIC